MLFGLVIGGGGSSFAETWEVFFILNSDNFYACRRENTMQLEKNVHGVRVSMLNLTGLYPMGHGPLSYRIPPGTKPNNK